MKPVTSTNPPPSRGDAWRQAAGFALVVTAVLLILVRMLTGIMMVAALGVGVFVFVLVFSLRLRMTPLD